MKYAKRILSVLSVILMLLVVLPRAYAAPTPDLEQKGSITVHLAWQGKPLSGGTVTLHRVAGLNDKLEYVAEPDFAGSGADLSAPATAKLARTLAKYADAQEISGQQKAIDRSGTAIFEALEPGLYLMVQERVREGYLPFNPFLVSIPQIVGDELIYDVDASPKCEPEPKPTDPTQPTKPDTPPGLPQTGQTNWPVPVLGITGLILVFTGVVLCLPERRKRHET